jgi:hypothetical protein
MGKVKYHFLLPQRVQFLGRPALKRYLFPPVRKVGSTNTHIFPMVPCSESLRPAHDRRSSDQKPDSPKANTVSQVHMMAMWNPWWRRSIDHGRWPSERTASSAASFICEATKVYWVHWSGQDEWGSSVELQNHQAQVDFLPPKWRPYETSPDGMWRMWMSSENKPQLDSSTRVGQVVVVISPGTIGQKHCQRIERVC